MLANCICRFSIISPFFVTFHPSHSEKQAGNFDNPSSNCKECDWISVITSMSGLLEKCQKVCSSAGSVKNCSGVVVVFFFFFSLCFLASSTMQKGKNQLQENEGFPEYTDF